LATGLVPTKVEPVTLYDFFKKFEQDTILIAAREYQTPALLPEEVKEYLQEKGSRLPSLLFPGSYVGIFSHGAKIFEKIDAKGAVKIGKGTYREGQVNQRYCLVFRGRPLRQPGIHKSGGRGAFQEPRRPQYGGS
jgi:hypothetical protein